MLCAMALLPILFMSGVAQAVDPPTNIRIEQNVLLWDDVPGANKYNIYYFTHPSAEDVGNSIQYRATVDGRNKYLPTEVGFLHCGDSRIKQPGQSRIFRADR